MTPPPSSEGSGGGTDRRREVDELVRTIHTDASRKEPPPPSGSGSRRPSPVHYAVLLILVALTVWAWIARPAWLTGGDSGVETVAEAEGLLRFRLFVQGQRIRAYEARTGRLPESLEEAGVEYEGIEYRRTGPDDWELVGTLGDARLVLTSAMPIEEFLAEGDNP